jgi:hypothetical protein
MRKILITGGFSGVIELTYDSIGNGLCCLDFRGAELSLNQRNWMLKNIPVIYGEGFEACFAGAKNLKFTTSDVQVEFEADFWEPYGMPINRKRVEKRWSNMSNAARTAAVNGLRGYLWHLSQVQWKTKANPDTYLKDKFWETDWYNL